ncbi:sensor domain-containing diguanylate cyclase [Vibrio kyushuensis]|uniref:sensor domain-containing diguanylate cyclase n=1 Tax=Vibrio kyushuensis TaxID=2910249 RepID=UPI003D11FD26
MTNHSNITSFLEYLGEATILVNKECIISFANTACLNLFAYSENELIGKSINIVVEPKFNEHHSKLVESYIASESMPKRMMSRTTINCIAKSGEILQVKISLTTLEIDGDKFGLAIIQDYTEHHQFIENLKEEVNTDPLTMLHNRRYLDAIILSDSRWYKSVHSVAVLYLDLNNFKPINDDYGHDYGDHILKTVALRMKETLRYNDLIFRVGGDEFVIMLNLEESKQPLQDVRSVSEKLHHKISCPITVQGTVFTVGASIGIGLFPQDFEDIEIVLKLADKAMYHGKRNMQAISYVADLPTISKGE